MEIKKTGTHSELMLRIMELKDEKFQQEEDIKRNFKEFAYTLNPISIIKETVHELAQDKEVQVDAVKVGLNVGANFLIARVLGKNNSMKGYLSSVLVQTITSSIINNNMKVSDIISGITNMFSKPPEEEEQTQPKTQNHENA